MPELPEAEYMVRRLAEYASGGEVRRIRLLRPDVADARVARLGKGSITGYSRRAKNVLMHLASGYSVRVQLGMTGHVYWTPDARRPPEYTRVLFELNGGSAIAFQDARVFGRVEVHKTLALDSVFASYGPEPLDPAFTWRDLRAIAARRRTPVKPLLLDQSVIAGLGNIWVAESLFHARIHPARLASSLEDAEWRALHASIRKTLTKAIANTFRVTNGPADFPEADLLVTAVYGRRGERCRRCAHAVRRVVMSGRSTFFCAACQKA